MRNFTYWMENFVEHSLLGYTDILGVLVYPLIFVAIIGYVYMKNQSFTALVVIVLVLLVAFNGVVAEIPLLYTFIYIAVSLIVTGIFLAFFTRLRR